MDKNPYNTANLLKKKVLENFFKKKIKIMIFLKKACNFSKNKYYIYKK